MVSEVHGGESEVRCRQSIFVNHTSRSFARCNAWRTTSSIASSLATTKRYMMRFFFSVESHTPLYEYRRVSPTACHPNARTIRSLHTPQARARQKAARWLHCVAFARNFIGCKWHRDVGAVGLFPSSVSFPIPLVALFARYGFPRSVRRPFPRPRGRFRGQLA